MDNTEQVAIAENIKKGGESNNNKDNKDKILKIDGILHSLHETKSIKSKHNILQGEVSFNCHDVIND